MSTKQQFISSFSWNTLTVVLQIVIQLIYTSVLARLITQDSFAIMGIALTLVGFAEVFSQIGIGPALIQRKEINQQHINGAFFSSLLLGLSFTAIFFFAAPFIANYYENETLSDVIRVISLAFTLSAIAVVPRSLIIKKMDFRKYFVAGIVSIVGGNLIIGLILAFMDYDIWAYVFALFSQNVLLTLCFWLLRPTKITSSWKWKPTRELIRYGGGATLFNAFNFAATKIDLLVVPNPDTGASEGRLSQAGIYERSAYLMSLPITILGKLSDNVMFSGLSLLQDQKAKLHRAFLSATYFVSLLVVPGCIFIICFAKEIVLIYLGVDYAPAIPIVQILFAGVIFRSMIKLCDSVIRALDAVYRGSLIKFFFVLLVGFGAFYGLKYGLKGVAYAIVIATILQFLVISIFSMSLIKISIGDWFNQMIPAFKIALIVAAISIPMRFGIDRYDLSAVPGIAIGILGNMTVVAAFAWFLPGIFGKGDKNILNLLVEKLPQNSLVRSFRKRLK